MRIKKILARILGRPDLVGYFLADFRPFLAENPHLKKKIMVFLAIFEKIWGLFFSKTFFGLKSPRNAWKWFLTSSLGPKDDWDLILDHF